MNTSDMSPEPVHRISLRLPHDLHARLIAATKESRRSAHAEILYSLQITLPYLPFDIDQVHLDAEEQKP